MLPSRKTVLCILASWAVVRLVSKSLRSRRGGSPAQSQDCAGCCNVKARARNPLESSTTSATTSSGRPISAPSSRFFGQNAFAGGGWLAFATLLVMEFWGARVAVTVGVACCVLLIVAVYLHAQFKAAPRPNADTPPNRKLLTNVDLSGTWVKDNDASDSLEPVMKVMQLNPIVRAATRLVRGLELKQTDDTFKVSVCSMIRWFKIHEEYPLSGAVRRHSRRDLRRGRQRGSVAWVGDTLRLTVAWDDPLGGWGTDDFKLISHSELHVETSLKQEGQDAVRYRIVYRRKS